MIDKVARREAREAREKGFCGFCFRTGKPLLHSPTCKLVAEHGQRIGLGPKHVAPESDNTGHADPAATV